MIRTEALRIKQNLENLEPNLKNLTVSDTYLRKFLKRNHLKIRRINTKRKIILEDA